MTQQNILIKNNTNKKIFVFLFVITFTVFVFTNDAHRFTIDEDQGQLLAKRIATQTAHPLYVQNESRLLFEFPLLFPNVSGPLCQNPLLCSAASIGYALTEIPFVFINHQINQVLPLNYVLSENDFDNSSYVYWRNSLDPDFLLLEILYGPIFSALSISVFFLICKTFNYSEKTSITLSLLFAFSTLILAYSKTSLNTLPFVTFILLGYWSFRKYQNSNSATSLLLCGSFFGFAYLIRQEAIFFILPIFLFQILHFKSINAKIKKFFAFVLPLFFSFLLQKFVDYLNFGLQGIGIASGSTSRVTTLSNVLCLSNQWGCNLLHEGVSGLFLSPGVGLLIFSPILFTIFFSFPEFFKNNKKEFFLFLTIIGLFLWYFGQSDAWHGLNAWGPRYMIPLIPFLLLPLGSSIEIRKNRFLVILVILGLIGIFFNFAYIIQDVPYFVWGGFGVTGDPGLYGLATAADKYSVHPTVLWTFENSQLTHSISLLFTHLQPDIFLLKLLGFFGYSIILSVSLFFLFWFFVRMLKKNNIYNSNRSII